MTIQEQEELCHKAFIDVVNYFADVCPNMLTFYNMFKPNPSPDVMTIRINTQDSYCPILDYNPNWVVKAYTQETKYHFIYAVYVEMLRFILHHTTTRLCGPNTACASSVVTNIKESRSVFDFLPRSTREDIIAFLDSMPSKNWLQALIEPNPLDDRSMTLENVEVILNQVVEANAVKDPNLEHYEATEEPDEEEEIVLPQYAYNVGPYVKLMNTTSSLDDYYSGRSRYECSAAWAENNALDEHIRVTFEQCETGGWGTGMSAEQIGKFKVANKRHANVKAILNRIRGQILSTNRERTRMRPNRRGLNEMGERHDTIGTALIAYDVSGSMGEEDINAGISIIESFLSGAKIDYTFWDTNCMKPEPLNKRLVVGEEIRALVGGGGTVPECIGEKLKAEKLKYDAVIIFTDTFWSWPKRNIPANTQLVVISTENSESLRKLPGFVNFAMKMEDVLNIKRGLK